jgi:hypothetical protein
MVGAAMRLVCSVKSLGRNTPERSRSYADLDRNTVERLFTEQINHHNYYRSIKHV